MSRENNTNRIIRHNFRSSVKKVIRNLKITKVGIQALSDHFISFFNSREENRMKRKRILRVREDIHENNTIPS